MSERICHFCISKGAWYEAISALREHGWSLDMGGGLDHSWAVLERGNLRVEMEYDIWGDEELVLNAAEGVEAENLLLTAVLAILEVS
ncbi:hypothetical protein O8B93_21930 [Agrobacterium rhizogenes]|uniref:hypothetical protein n=1 Tax=Rhizobium rhizogenes TaxID=359 RepID=UPI0022B6A03B|nr:hypothetical protein [Rhizobium rhizogenes]MCZ7450247.1 hypothetical protein [Rhizobium rhizogenes]